MKKTTHAFTLVELLVVIVIIGILAGIALPAFQKAQERSRAISDASNLRQLGIGVQAFKSDNNGDILASDADGKWPQKLNPTYVSTWKVFKSPFDDRTPSEIAASAPVSYGVNNVAGTNGTLLGMDSSKINYPSNLILMAPNIANSAGKVVYNAKKGTEDVFVTETQFSTDKRGSHSDRLRVNVLYADGHTEDILCSKIKEKTTDEGKKRWIYDTE